MSKPICHMWWCRLGYPHGYMHPEEEISTTIDVTLQWRATTITFPGSVELEYSTIICALTFLLVQLTLPKQRTEERK